MQTNITSIFNENNILQDNNNFQKERTQVTSSKKKYGILIMIANLFKLINPFKRKQKIVYQSIASYSQPTFVAPISSYNGKNENYLLKLAQQEFNNMDITQATRN